MLVLTPHIRWLVLLEERKFIPTHHCEQLQFGFECLLDLLLDVRGVFISRHREHGPFFRDGAHLLPYTPPKVAFRARASLYSIVQVWPDSDAPMTDDAGFKILKWRDRTQLLAGCERCQLKFITPAPMLRDDPQAVEYYLREKYVYHTCQPPKSSKTRSKGFGP